MIDNIQDKIKNCVEAIKNKSFTGDIVITCTTKFFNKLMSHKRIKRIVLLDNNQVHPILKPVWRAKKLSGEITLSFKQWCKCGGTK